MRVVARRLVDVSAAPDPPHPSGVALAFELTDLAERMVAQRYRREHPEASEEAVNTAVTAWYRDRPGAEIGDCAGPTFRYVGADIAERHSH